MAGVERAQQHRQRMRERGFRPVQVWVPDVRTDAFAAEARHQAELVAAADRNGDDQDFVDAISAAWDDE
jgi:G:T-mismatch repair DNA endonuclease (very short patch repair protein)